MLVVVSPAKKLDWSEAPYGGSMTDPVFAAEAAGLRDVARRLSPAQLQKLMRISPALAALNFERFRAFSASPDPESLRPAVFAFAGDTYQGLEARSLDPDEIACAQVRLRILSGLYGVLRPLDAIQPYRLEMGSRLGTSRGRTLYDWWGDRIAERLNADAEAAGTDLLVNCASVEYFSAVSEALRPRVVTPVFLEERDGSRSIVSFHAKRARGAMARFILQRRITAPEGLHDFDAGGYAHAPDLSEGDRMVFVRAWPAA
ncbi:peroxide stress protein YaaA [Maritimibacter sp. 55A14]|uniref:peroxide stress protein YaaA n=1 Tax=Maritimibacter sp. 55A14 TaxID=2174844 RepID=UPI000D604C38|nr:peroxide stress protein YaaA [Maritimibacter sp. 55A14]PWE33476.1 peroxide stress protein YaaA [Maritimibacter sp. 55A14]